MISIQHLQIGQRQYVKYLINLKISKTIVPVVLCKALDMFGINHLFTECSKTTQAIKFVGKLITVYL